MPGLLLLSQGEAIGGSIGFAALCISVAAYYIAVEWRKVRQAQMDADLKREMIQKGLPLDEIDRVLKMSSPLRE